MKTILFLLIFSLSGSQTYAGQKAILGETAWISVAHLPFSYLARIDTGAKTTSIHATRIKIVGESKKFSDNIGKTISFQTMNRNSQPQLITTTITRVSTVKNNMGIEQRYVIQLPLSWKKITKTVEVNLRNRTKMRYKLLIGRNFLKNNFVVDVDIKANTEIE